MNDKYKGMVLGAFVADSLALGAHWVYDTKLMDKQVGRVTDLRDPLAKNFHPNRTAGEHTHYGDQMLLFFKYLQNAGNLNSGDYMKQWTAFFDSYDGYKDHAMQDTRKNLEQKVVPSGSVSTDLAGVLYIPILTAYKRNNENLKSDVDTAVRMTHNRDSVVEAGQFLAILLNDVLDGNSPIESIKKQQETNSVPLALKLLIRKGLDSIGKNTRSTIALFGQSCPADYGLPGVVHLIGTYENNFEKGLIENVMAGGDSAARGIFTGAVLGAHNGVGKIPERWISGLSVAGDISGGM